MFRNLMVVYKKSGAPTQTLIYYDRHYKELPNAKQRPFTTGPGLEPWSRPPAAAGPTDLSAPAGAGSRIPKG